MDPSDVIAALFGGIGIDHNYFPKYTPKEGDIMIDLGAHKGEVSLPFSDILSKLILVEPSPANCSYLLNTLQTQHYQNIVLIMGSVWKSNGFSQIHEGQTTTSACLFEDNIRVSNSYPTILMTLDDIVKICNLKRIDFIKCDIEGAELEALEGGKHTLAITKNIAIASYHVRSGEKTYKRVEEILRRAGFKVETLLLKKEKEVTYGTR